jgi:L-malate glycosyltransferase
MRILHICSYYIGNKLYMNLMKELSFKGLKQEIFIPVRNDEQVGRNQLSTQFSTVNYYYRNLLKKHDKFLFFNKIKKQMTKIEDSIPEIGNVDVIHAHTVFSDGGTAYKLYKKYGIDYIVNVRNTDINTFYRYGLHLRPFMYKVLLNARGIVFISHAYKKQMLALLPSSILSQIMDKCFVIPNGIDDYWHQNVVEEKSKENPNVVKMIFIGAINKNKNLSSVIYAGKQLQKEGFKVLLNVIGTGPLEDKCKDLCKRLDMEKEVRFYGYLKDKEHIASIMDKSEIFIMPSMKETFGLVYIEAMSRGLPVIYTKGQGIDGLFEEGSVGYSVNSMSVDNIVERIKDINNNYNAISKSCLESLSGFHWEEISNKYNNLYYYETI